MAKGDKTNYPSGQKKWLDLDYQTRLEIAQFIFDAVSYIPGSFRRVIYDRLGFQGNAYVPLYEAGGMWITNAISDYEDKCASFPSCDGNPGKI